MTPRLSTNKLAKVYLLMMELVFICSSVPVLICDFSRSTQESLLHRGLVIASGVSMILLLVSSPFLYCINRRFGQIALATLFIALCVAILFPRL